MKKITLGVAALAVAVLAVSLALLSGDGGSPSAASVTTASPGERPGTGVAAPGPVMPGDVPDPFRRGETPPSGYRQLLGRDDIRPVYDPGFVAAGEIDWSGDDLVLGVEIDGDARAYSIAYLNQREMVNDRIAGIPVLVTW